MTNRTYHTTKSSIWFTLLVLPFTLPFLVIGMVALTHGVANVLSIGFTLVGGLATYSVLNYSHSQTTVTPTGITKKNLLAPKREIPWGNIVSWRYVEDSEAGIERVEIRTMAGKTIPFYVNEVESEGIRSFIEDIKGYIEGSEPTTP